MKYYMMTSFGIFFYLITIYRLYITFSQPFTWLNLLIALIFLNLGMILFRFGRRGNAAQTAQTTPPPKKNPNPYKQNQKK